MDKKSNKPNKSVYIINNNPPSPARESYYSTKETIAVDSYNSSRKKSFYKTGGGLLGLVVMCLLAISVFGWLNGNDRVFTFESFLNLLETVPKQNITWIATLNTLPEIDWTMTLNFTWLVKGWYLNLDFNFLKGVWDIFSPIIAVPLYLYTGIKQVIDFVSYFLLYIFV